MERIFKILRDMYVVAHVVADMVFDCCDFSIFRLIGFQVMLVFDRQDDLA